MKNLTILICGKLDTTSLDYIDIYKKWGKVVVSCWAADDPSMLKALEDSGIEVVKNNPNDVEVYKPFIGKKSSTAPYQIVTISGGVKCCNTPYILKTRSDEHFTNLTPLIYKFLEDIEKIVYMNIFARSFKNSAFAISDHLWIGKTIVFDRAFNLMAKTYQEKEPASWAIQRRGNSIEQILCQAFLLAKEKRLTAPINELASNFDVVDVNSLGEYVIKNNHQKRIWHSKYVRYIGEITTGKQLWDDS